MAQKDSASKGRFVPREEAIALYFSLAVKDRYLGYIVARNNVIRRLSLVVVTLLTISGITFSTIKFFDNIILDNIIFIFVVIFSMFGYWASGYSFLAPAKVLHRHMMENFFSEEKIDFEKMTWEEFGDIVKQKRLLSIYNAHVPDLSLLDMIAYHEIRKLTYYDYRVICKEEKYKKMLDISSIKRFFALFIPFSKQAYEMLDTINEIVDNIILKEINN